MTNTSEITQTGQNKKLQSAKVVSKSFNFADFKNAIVYPLKFKMGLIIGATVILLLSFGQSGSVLAISIYSTAVICFMLATVLKFGCLTNTVENFSQAKTKPGFMSDFDKFSIWEDVVHPFFLSLAVYLVSFGLLAALLVGAVWQASEATNKIEADKQKILSVVLPGAQNTPNFASQNDDFYQTAGTVMRLSLDYSVPIFLALLWGIFYFPAACVVAGYRRSFIEIFNPLVGFNVIRRLGTDYLKIVLIFLILVVSAAGLNAILQTILSPLNSLMPGNLPAKVAAGIFVFYGSIVFSVTLGFVLLKSSVRRNFRRI